uniref:Histone domain-containing protein n=1 Tax=Caenorhabditis tropicalis TaxID=1561998 RepID=A0A1I7UXC5_9PELO
MSRDSSPRVRFLYGPRPEDPPATDSFDIPMGRHRYTDSESDNEELMEDSEGELEIEEEEEAGGISEDSGSVSDDELEIEEEEIEDEAEEMSEESFSDEEEESDGDDVTSRVPIPGEPLETPDFEGMVKEIIQNEMRNGRQFKIERDAIGILRLESEKMLTELFKKSNAIANAGGREKLKVTDIQAARQIEEILKKYTK